MLQVCRLDADPSLARVRALLRSAPKPRHADGDSRHVNNIHVWFLAVSDPEYAAPTPGFLVWRLSTKWRTAVDRAVGPLGLTHAQYSLISSLLAMHERGLKPSQRELADHTGLEPLYVSKLARALEADDLIRRVADPDDSRAVRLSLTTEGHAVTLQATIIVRRLIDQLMEPIGGAAGDRAAGLVRDLSALLHAPLGPQFSLEAGE